MNNLNELIKEFHEKNEVTIYSKTDEIEEAFEDYLLKNKIMYDVEISYGCSRFINNSNK